MQWSFIPEVLEFNFLNDLIWKTTYDEGMVFVIYFLMGGLLCF